MNAKIVCAWCGRKIRDTKIDNGKDSYSICVECYEKVMDELKGIQKFKLIFEKSSNIAINE